LRLPHRIRKRSSNPLLKVAFNNPEDLTTTKMAIFNRSSSSSNESPRQKDPEMYGKTEYTTGTTAQPRVDENGITIYEDNNHLHRGLKSRHITMIAIGGAIGTGLIIGTGKALAQSG
jgi:amino acid transporter